MFNLDLSSSYWWPVPFGVPAEDGLKVLEMSFEAQFRRMSTEEVDALLEDARVNKKPDSQVARSLLVGWRKVVGAGGAVPFTPEAFDRLLAVPGAGSSIMKAFFESLSKGAEKN